MNVKTKPIESLQSQKVMNSESEMAHRRMFSRISHDLRTPLASMIGSLEIYGRVKGKVPEEKRESLVTLALQEAYRLDNFISNVLEIENLENGSISPRARSLDISVFLHDCVANLESRFKAQDKGHLIQIDKLSEPVMITTDSDLLSKVITHILDNAVKYSGSKSVIRISYGQADNHYFISIQDNGEGVPDAERENIFAKYTRLPSSSSVSGAGLGLAICRRIMELLGGSISVTRAEDSNGAAFVLQLPV